MLKIKGKILVLNTIDNLGANQIVFIARNSIMVASTGDLYLYKFAQFVTSKVDLSGYIIPVEKDEQGSLSVDFSEVKFAFDTCSEKEALTLDKEVWLSCKVELEKQKDDIDWINRYNLDELFTHFDALLTNSDLSSQYYQTKQLFIEKIQKSSDLEALQEIVDYCNIDYAQRIEDNTEITKDEAQAALSRWNDIKSHIMEVGGWATKRVEKLSEKKLQACNADELNKLLKQAEEREDYIRMKEIMDEINSR